MPETTICRPGAESDAAPLEPSVAEGVPEDVPVREAVLEP